MSWGGSEGGRFKVAGSLGERLIAVAVDDTVDD